MKKRLFTRLTCLTLTAAIVLSFSGFIYADETGGDGAPQSVIDEDEGSIEKIDVNIDIDNDELAEMYIMSNMSSKIKRSNRKFDFSNQLQGNEKIMFDNILPEISKIAAGEVSSTVVTIPSDILCYS